MRVAALRDWGKGHWPLLRRVLTLGFVIVLLSLLGYAAANVHWGDVLQAVAHMPASALWQAVGLTLASYLVYACFELLGKRYTGHGLSWPRCYLIGIVVYAFLMTLGSSLGGLGLRLRLYTRAGVSAGDAARVFGLAVTTNWIGYCLIAGCVFTFGPLELPAQWRIGTSALRILGGSMALLAVAYVLLCFLSHRREWSLRGHRLELPSGTLSLLQMALAVVNWLLMGSVLYVLLRPQLSMAAVQEVVLLSAVAGLVVRLPAGLGVLEAIAVALLATSHLPQARVLAGVLVYRAIYYLAPLAVAGLWYLFMELCARQPDSAAPLAARDRS